MTEPLTLDELRLIQASLDRDIQAKATELVNVVRTADNTIGTGEIITPRRAMAFAEKRITMLQGKLDELRQLVRVSDSTQTRLIETFNMTTHAESADCTP